MLTIPEVHRADQNNVSAFENNVIVFDDVTITRRAPPDSEHVKNNNQRQNNKIKLTKVEKKEKKEQIKLERQLAKLNSIEKLLTTEESEVVAFELEHINLSIKKVNIYFLF